VLAIRHLADRVAQHVFADLGTFMLDRTIKAFIGADKTLVQRALGYPAEKTIARGEQRCARRVTKLIDLEDRPSSLH
jgi:hypothetical protein